jgi:hypothetical protein
VIRDERILSPVEADPVEPGDYVYLLAPPEKAEALDRFFVDMAPSSAPDPHLLGDFMVSGEHTLGELAAIYGVSAEEEQAKLTLADYFDIHLDHAPKEGAELVLDPIVLVARSISGGRVSVVGLRLPEDEEAAVPADAVAEVQAQARRYLVVGGGGLSARSLAQPTFHQGTFDDDEVGIRILLADRFRLSDTRRSGSRPSPFRNRRTPRRRCARAPRLPSARMAAAHDELRSEFLERPAAPREVVRVAFGLPNADAHDPVGFGHDQSPCSGSGDGSMADGSAACEGETAAINRANAARMAAACATRAPE